MRLGQLKEVIIKLIENGVSEDTIVFSPVLEGEQVVHLESGVIATFIEEGELAIIIYPEDAGFYEIEEDDGSGEINMN